MNSHACRQALVVAALVLLRAGTAAAAPTITSSTPAAGPTSGGTALTISGSDFSTTGNAVTVGSAECHIFGESTSSILCTSPEGSGAANEVQVVDALGQASNTTNFSYDAPSIDSINPTSGPAAGGTRLTINGNSFGTSASASVGGIACPMQAQTHTTIECTVPAGTGTDVPVVVSVAGQVSSPSLYDYISPPSISTITPENGSTAGGNILTINGSNFAASGNAATVGGSSCTVTAESPVSVLCTVPEGTGLDKEVEVVAGDQSSNTRLYDYDAPSILLVDPSHGPTQGSVPITIHGNDFGPAGADLLRSVLVGTSPCPLLPSSSDHTSIVCTLPEGQGLGNTLRVTVDAQPSNATTFDYDAPSIDSVTPSSGSVSGNIPITIRGLNFGTAASVSVGSGACPIDLQDHDELRCTLPPGTGADLSLLVTVSGQQAMSTFDYREVVCGDGFVDDDEDCDDSDTDDLDGCSAACETEFIQDREQAGCVLAMNKAGAKVVKAQAKDVAGCARDAEAGVACIGVTNSTPLDNAIALVALLHAKSCANFIPVNFTEIDFQVVQDANVDETLALARDLFGADPDAALVPDAMHPNRASCQQDVLKATSKLAVARLKAFGKCKKAGFKAETIRAGSQLAACLTTMDNDPALAKPTAAQFQSLIDSCLNLSEDLSLAFPGVCASSPDVGACLEDRVRCRTCRALVATDGLDDDCDLHDDATENASCP